MMKVRERDGRICSGETSEIIATIILMREGENECNP